MTSSRRKQIKAKTAPGVKRGVKLLAAVLVLVPLGTLLESVKLFRQLEQLLINTEIEQESLDSDTRVARVVIQTEDYNTLFGGRSPLAAGELLNLIRAVAAGSPCAVGVDIDTSDPGFSDFANLKFECPVIWARAAQYSNRDNRFLPSNIFGKPGPVALNQGLSVFTPDDDGLLRRYSRVVRSSQGDVPTFPWSILLSAHLSGDLKPSADFMLIRFLLPPSKSRRPGLIRIGAREVLELSKLHTWKDGILKGKVTLIGGDYDVADEHDTPAGFIFGIDLIADALQTELRGGGRRPPSTWLTFAIAFIAAAIYWITMRNLSWKQISVFGPLLVLLQAAICSWILAGSLSLVPLFTIVLAAVFAYQIWNHLNEKKEARAR